MTRVAALYDIHGNLPALEAVLAEVAAAEIDAVVVGGDVIPGPMPVETLQRLAGLEVPVHSIVGNGELAVLAQLDRAEDEPVRYWGTPSGAPPPASVQEVLRWTARQVGAQAARIQRWPGSYRMLIAGLGRVLFCHGTPRSETECFTRLTPEEALAPLFADVAADVVICGHTHMPFDRAVCGVRVMNAGSVGMPFGEPGADWLLLGPAVEFRHTRYDLKRAAARVRMTGYPQATDFADRSILSPPDSATMLEALTRPIQP